MGSRRGPYNPDFPVGTSVRIRDARYLQTFLSTRKLHNPLKAFQLAYAERVARVKEVGFYHGSDELYILHGIPGVWHEECLDLNANDDLASRH